LALGEFGLNMMLIEYGDAAIAIDCGPRFPALTCSVSIWSSPISYLLEHREA
jgi:mRNA degradation ribonuclease J1/J2